MEEGNEEGQEDGIRMLRKFDENWYYQAVREVDGQR